MKANGVDLSDEAALLVMIFQQVRPKRSDPLLQDLSKIASELTTLRDAIDPPALRAMREMKELLAAPKAMLGLKDPLRPFLDPSAELKAAINSAKLPSLKPFVGVDDLVKTANKGSLKPWR
jgi:hypothetical protein